MTQLEDEARAALLTSKTINAQQQAMTEESRLLLAAMLREEMRKAVREGIAEAMTDEAAERFWEKGLQVLQRQATERTGRLVLGGVAELAKKAAVLALGLWAAYQVAGMFGVKVAWTALTKGSP